MQLELYDSIIISFLVLGLAALGILIQSHLTAGRPSYGRSWIAFALLIVVGLLAARLRPIIGEFPGVLLTNVSFGTAATLLIRGVVSFEQHGRSSPRLWFAVLPYVLVSLFAVLPTDTLVLRIIVVGVLQSGAYLVAMVLLARGTAARSRGAQIAAVVLSAVNVGAWIARAILAAVWSPDALLSVDLQTVVPVAIVFVAHMLQAFALALLVQSRVWDRFVEETDRASRGARHEETTRILNSLVHGIMTPLGNAKVLSAFLSTELQESAGPDEIHHRDAVLGLQRSVDQALRRIERFQVLLQDNEDEAPRPASLAELCRRIPSYLTIGEAALTVHAGDDPVQVSTRPAVLLQTMTTIVDRMIEADPQHRHLEMEVRACQPPEIEIRGVATQALAQMREATAVRLDRLPEQLRLAYAIRNAETLLDLEVDAPARGHQDSRGSVVFRFSAGS